ncbi:phosphoadenosine phosphosulfate reductase [Pseudomonas chlororaphis]|uniref:phosphoadenosine phosphosulfate reductase n=1 Tax=Pseudomonas chlororaphis TaxID=587753 RepID=UPI003463775E
MSDKAPVVVSYGAGTNSTAVLIEMARRGEPVDLITFADTGGERPETYAYLEMFSGWLVQRGMPPIVTVRKGGRQETLEENCHRMNMLPSVAYGFKSCSQKYKGEPQDAYCNNWEPAKKAWANGGKVVKIIGYDADEPHRAKFYEDKKFVWRYPLLEWGMGRAECIEAIRAAGLQLPGKSSCFFCPNSKPQEILALPDDLKERAIAMERNAQLTNVKGLGRRWRWEDLIASDRDQLRLFDNSQQEMPCGCYDG